MNSLSAAHLDSVSETKAEAAHALPAWVYNHAGAHPARDRAGAEAELADRLPRQLDSRSRATTRPSISAPRACSCCAIATARSGRFHNVCRHRGARLLDGSGNCPATITCPYHGWSYRQDGSLIGVPMRDTFPGLDRAEHSLRPVRVDTALGFVFVCLAGDPPPVARTWGRLAEELAAVSPARKWCRSAPISTDVWNVDWKIAMDNYLESYHVPIGHPGLYRMFTPDYEDQATVPGVARGVSWMREQPSSRWSERLYQKLIGERGDAPARAERRCWRFYSALPNLGIDVFPDQMDFFQVLPAGPGKCMVRGAVFGLPGRAAGNCVRCAS